MNKLLISLFKPGLLVLDGSIYNNGEFIILDDAKIRQRTAVIVSGIVFGLIGFGIAWMIYA